LVLGLYAQVYRYRRVSTPDERQQTKWVLFGFVLWIGYILISSYPFFYLESLPEGATLPWWTSLSTLGWWLSLNIIPVSLAVAIMRSRLWNINVVINRALVYGGLTFITMALYIIVVGALGNLLRVGNTFIAFLTTGLVAVLFQPLRDRLQGWVNRLMYGERDDPVAVLSQLGSDLEHTGSPEDALSSIVKTVSMTLKLPYVAIELGEEHEVAASYGIPKPDVVRLPMYYQAERSGYLVVAPRAPGESFSMSDHRLLENIAQQAGAAAHAVKLTADLRQSRQRLVTAREEERRRLRRDLHDGLGPTLASLTLKIDATRNLLRNEPAKAEAQLDELKRQTQETIQDIRTLVYDLRPPALDELGLVGAIQNFIAVQVSGRPQITLETPQTLPLLPAALEVALYRITLEGITNIIRHADADTAMVRISPMNDHLILEISDDGVGIPANVFPGVGLTSMSERADELGGAFAFLPKEKGTHIRVRLPFIEEENDE
jgi:signal transduction histidine kinase